MLNGSTLSQLSKIMQRCPLLILDVQQRGAIG